MQARGYTANEQSRISNRNDYFGSYGSPKNSYGKPREQFLSPNFDQKYPTTQKYSSPQPFAKSMQQIYLSPHEEP